MTDKQNNSSNEALLDSVFFLPIIKFEAADSDN